KAPRGDRQCEPRGDERLAAVVLPPVRGRERQRGDREEEQDERDRRRRRDGRVQIHATARSFHTAKPLASPPRSCPGGCRAARQRSGKTASRARPIVASSRATRAASGATVPYQSGTCPRGVQSVGSC